MEPDGDAKIEWLKLSIAMLLCKVAEYELQNRLIVPFKEDCSKKGKIFRDDPQLFSLSKYMNGIHPPTVGGIERALRDAS